MKLLEEIARHCTLSEKARAAITSVSKQLTFKKNQHLLSYGKPCRYLYFVNSGLLRGYYLAEGKEITNWLAAEGELGVSYYSFMTGEISHEAIQALEDCEVSAIALQDLNSIYRDYPETERAGRLIMQNYYLQLEVRLVALQFRSASQRYRHLEASRPLLIRRAPLGCIASYLGITQETLSRIRSPK